MKRPCVPFVLFIFFAAAFPGAASGAVAGLVAITPVAGFVGVGGAILTGVFCDPILGGSGIYDYVTNTVGEYDMLAQIVSQSWGVATAIVWSGAFSLSASWRCPLFPVFPQLLFRG